MKGIEKLREKLPDYQGKRIYIFNIIQEQKRKEYEDKLSEHQKV